MRFNKITYHNYRCFLDGTISFHESKDRNINILIGPNGGGKTETLFSFWWTLYGFDFSSLRAKESTDYALNLDLYRDLERAEPGTTKTCSVVLEFEHQGVRYEVTKKCDYKRGEKRITSHEYQEFSSYATNGEKSLPERDPEEIKKKLNRIIPKSILYGIIFDGERMQRLSATSESSKNAIRGVISDITNVELLEKCSDNFESIKKSLNKQLKKSAAKSNQLNLNEIIDKLAEKENRKKELEEYISTGEETLEVCEDRCNEISLELESNELVKGIENSRKQERSKIEDYEKKLDLFYKNFSASLKDAYLLTANPILDDVDSIIQKYDVPADLTVPAVRNILKRDKCICGKPLDDEAIRVLEDLIGSLPPDNINSTLAEIIRQFRDRVNDIMGQTSANYGYIQTCESDIKNSKDLIASYTTQISELTEGQTSDDVEYIKNLEAENKARREKIGELKAQLPKAKEELNDVKRDIKNLSKQRDEYSSSEDVSKVITKQISFIEKCLEALERIRKENKDSALSAINERLDDAYRLLSEDAELGRQIKIIQYDEKMMYNLVVYMKDSFDELLSSWKTDGTYIKLVNQGLSEEAIEEQAILQCIDPNSTGQSKMNTFAFVKAILDYSNLNKKDDGIEIQKEYPLLIDAPFGDISGENLNRSSSELHSFTGQIILMLDKDRYRTLRPNLDKYISNKYEYKKIENQHYTTIEAVDEV